jgi:predicted TIM-barrel fold metal-dependent hydrolase
MTDQDLLLRDFHPKSALVTEEHIPLKPKFPVFDAHVHFGKWKREGKLFDVATDGAWTVQDVPAALALLDDVNVRYVASMDGGWGDLLRQNLERYTQHYPDRFCTFCWVDWEDAVKPGGGEKWARELEKSVKAGAVGLKIFKTLGCKFRDELGKLIMQDDPRLDPIWQAAAELNIPVMIHTGDPVAFYEPLDPDNERYEELHEHPDWHFYGKDYPPFNEMITRLLHLVESHPKTKFIGAHVMCYSENLGFVANALDRFPNLYVDITERIGEMGRQPYTARRFLIRYADRILFGTDSFSVELDHYRTTYRFLETEDEYFSYGRNQGRWNIYGVNLPDDVLRKIYHENALKLYPGSRAKWK